MGKKFKLRVHDRGIPTSYDPYSFYRYRLENISKQATGIEGLVYQLVPWDYIRSFAFAIDPFSRFKTAPGKVAKVSRIRYRYTASILDGRKIEKRKLSQSWSSIQNFMNHNGLVGPIKYNPPTTEYSEVVASRQQPLQSVSKDTTRALRAPDEELGEFEKIKFNIYSSGRSIYTSYVVDVWDPISSGYLMPSHDGYRNSVSYTVGPSAATIRRTLADNFAASEKDILLETMKENCLAMFKGVNPQHRNSSIFRNVAELHDLPRSIATLRESASKLMKFEREFFHDLLNIRKQVNNFNAVIGQIPKEYVSYHFGWKQLYKDAMDLLTSPAKVSKQIDMLIRRSGKATTYRSTRNFTSGSSALNGFDYEVLEGESQKSLTHEIKRVIRLDMVINTTFTFPTINTPDFRERLFLDKLGVYPRATDIYNLIPWTWLVDWVTGLGNYVEILDEINHDKSLINWGFLTGHSTSELVSTIVTEASSTKIDYNIRQGAVFDTTKVNYNHSSVLEVKLQLRNSLASLFDVGSATGFRTLSDYQQSILGALLFQRVKHT